MKKLVISVVLVNLLAACASQKAPEAAAPAAAPAPVAVVAPVAAPAAAPAPVVAVDPLNDPASILAKRSVYYAFDKDAVPAEDKPMLQAHGKYLSEHAARKVEVAGYADERGSNEYNLALGQRRANGVAKLLTLSGAGAAQVKTVSYGEEKPKAAGHNEAAWSQNRRSDLNYAQ